MLSRLSIRIRLTLIFAGAMTIVLVGIGAFVYERVGSSLSSSLNHDLHVRADDVGALLHRTHGDARDFGGAEGVAQLLAADGRVARSTPALGIGSLLTATELRTARRGPLLLERGSLPGLGAGAWRLLAVPISAGPQSQVAVVASSLKPLEETRDHLLAQLLLGGVALLLVASLGGYALAASALRPVEAMSRKAAAISLRGDDKRLPVPCTGDEIAKLGSRLNEMLARIEAAFAHERRFLADASHELQTPLAILRTELELAVRRPRSREELDEVVRSALEETHRLGRLAEDLLVVARSDQGALPANVTTVSAAELLSGVAERFSPRARTDGRQLTVRVKPEMQFVCDPLRIGQALGNLLDNSLRYGSGDITLVAGEHRDVVELHVRDGGGGFPASFLPRAFERFSRADDARSRGGSGLGLAIVEAIAQSHGGSARAANRRGGGTDVWIALPKEVV